MRKADGQFHDGKMRRFLLYFLVSGLIGLVAILAADYLRFQNDREQALAQLQARLGNAANSLARDLAQAVTDIRVLVDSRVLKQYAHDPSTRNLQAVVEKVESLVAFSGMYQQARFFSAQGTELARVIKDGPILTGLQVTPLPSFCLDQSLTRGAGHIFITSIASSNRDASQLAAVCIGTAVVSAPTRLQAVVTLNYPGDRLIDPVEGALEHSGGAAALLASPNGYLMFISDHYRVPYRRIQDYIELDIEYSNMWRQIADQDAGQVQAGAHTVLFRTVGAEDLMAAKSFIHARPENEVAVDIGGEAWKLLGWMPASATSYWLPNRLLDNGPLTGVVLLVMAVLSAIAAASRTQVIEQRLAVKQSEARLRWILDSTNVLAYLMDINQRYVFVNSRFKELLGAQGDALLGKTSRQLPPRIRQAFFAHNDEVMRTGVAMEFEETLEIGDCKRVFQSFKVPLRDQAGDLSGICSLSSEITDLKLAEEQMRQAAVVFDNTAEGIIVTDADKHTIAVNKAFLRMSGYDLSEVVGREFGFQGVGMQDEPFLESFWQAVCDSGHWQGEIWNRRASGEVYPVWATISVVRDTRNEVTHYVAVLSDISVLKEAESRLQHLAHHDALTNLPNRILFQAKLDQALEEAKRHRRQVALLFLDLDRFKLVNDTQGHHIGDLLLQTVAERLRGCVRGEDTVARLGGDEFTIILNQVEQVENLGRVARKILAATAEPMVLDGVAVTVGVSIGIAVFPHDAGSSQELAMAADAAMYRAKESGRATYAFFTPQLTEASLRRVELERELRHALAHGELRMYYQPQVSLRDFKVVGVEALLRWQHPHKGLLPPSELIKVAEDSGLILELGDWIMQAVCEQIQQWQQQKFWVGPVAVNVSGHQIANAEFVQRLEQLLVQHQLIHNGVCLEIEITESVLHLPEQLAKVVDRLHQLGVNTVIDDFGTGYSSLHQLKHLAVDQLKIAGLFVRDIPHDRNDAAIASAVVSLGHSLNLPVVAEEVENKDQVTFLQSLGCDVAQGYLFAYPVAPEALPGLCRDIERRFQAEVES